MSEICLILVHTSSHAIALEKKLKAKGIRAELSSIPRGVSSDCGICVRFACVDFGEVERVVQDFPYEIQEILRYTQDE